MIAASRRALKRLFIFLIGVAIASIAAFDIYPYVHRRLPFGLAILVCYAALAYILLPAGIRLYRTFVQPRHLPLYCITPDGFASDPINIGLIGSRRQVISAMEAAGWHLADPYRGRYMARYFLAMVLGHAYDNAPLSKLYLFGRKQDLGFEILIGSVHARHHVRFWATSYSPGQPLRPHRIHWHDRSAEQVDGELVWVGAASLDKGLAPIRHNLQLTHMIKPDTNKERDLIVKSLKEVGWTQKTEQLTLWNPYRLVNRAFRGYLDTDGQMAIVTLKSKAPGSDVRLAKSARQR